MPISPRASERGALLLLAAVAFAAFLAIASAVAAGSVHPFDVAGLYALRDPADAAKPFGPAWLQETVRDFTALGSNGILSALVLAGSGFLALARQRDGAAFLLASFCGALGLDIAAKHWIERPRPDLVPHAARVFTSSFPSSHATVSAAACLAVALLLAQARPALLFKAFATAMALVFTVLIGANRVYLGVHWPTDILAGWALGVAWTALCWAALRR